MKKTLLSAFLCVGAISTTGCDADVIKVSKCAIADDQLSVAFKDPKRAWKDLGILIEANEKGERVDDTISLLNKIRACVRPLVK